MHIQNYILMKKLFLYIFLLNLFFNSVGNSKENFFEKAKNKYDKKEMEDSKFLFQRNIVFNPKDAQSYLYLAKIYKYEENEKEEFKNLKATLLLEPDNEEAIYMLIDFEIEKANFSEVKNLNKKFKTICSSLCNKTNDIKARLKDIESGKKNN